MEKLKFTKIFNSFVENYEIDEDSVQLTFSDPSRTSKLSETRTLYYREISNMVRNHLLLCVKFNGSESLFAFAFWIPDDLISLEKSLEDILEQFALRFGCQVKIDNLERLYIRKVVTTFSGDLNELDNLMKTNIWTTTPTFRHFIARPKGDKVIYTCVFAINNYLYWVWLRNIEVHSVEVRLDWFDYLNNVVQNLNPIKKTKLEIITSKPNPYSTKASLRKEKNENSVKLNLYKIYLSEIEVIKRSLEVGNNVLVTTSLSVKRCVFCGDEAPSQEHILPTWFRKYFEEKTFDGLTHSIKAKVWEDYVGFADALNFGLSKGKESSYGITTYEVCINCNNRWMAELEKEVKKIITRDHQVLKDTIDELQLTSDKGFTMSRWLICKALLLSRRVKLLPTLGREIFTKLKDGQIHSGFLVEIFPISVFGINYQIKVGVPIIKVAEENHDTVSKLAKDFFVVVLHIGHFFFRISYWEHDAVYPRVSLGFKTIVLFSLENVRYHDYNVDSAIVELDDNSKLMMFLEALAISER